MCRWLRLAVLCLHSLLAGSAAPGSCQLCAYHDEHPEGASSLLQRAAQHRDRAQSPQTSRADAAAAPRKSEVSSKKAPEGRWDYKVVFTQVFSGLKTRPPSWSAQIDEEELIFIVVGGLTSMSVFLVGIVAYQKLHSGKAALQEPEETKPSGLGSRAATPATEPSMTRESLPSLGRRPASELPFHLCDALIVPTGKRLVCRVACRLFKERQDVEFDITSSRSRGQSPLMLVRAAELSRYASRPQISIAHPNDGEPLATILTEDLYRPEVALEDKALSVLGASGIRFGAFRKSGGQYVLTRSDGSFIQFSGRFRSHDVSVLMGSLRIASAESADEEAYQVVIESGVDAGLVLLGLLAIDKIEMPGPRGRGN